MRIVIDMQGAQSSGSRKRGIGRYTLSLSRAIVRNRGEHEIILALNGLFPETIESIRAYFDDLLPQESIHVWYAPGPVNCLIREQDWRRKRVELLREAFLAKLKPDIILVSSLFEGGDDAVTSIGMLGNIPTAVILYDLIPWIYSDIYLANQVAAEWYSNKLDHLRRADLILAISESACQEGINYFGFQEGTTVNISTAADHQFQPQSISSQQETEIRERYKLLRPYVMYTGGIDHRKNIEGLIRAYASLPKALRSQHQLAIVCAIQPHDTTRLEELAKECQLKKEELVLTGFIPEDDLLALYALCKLFVFPSWHEGFGLPALEAMSCGRAVIGSNTSSLPEVIGREDALFDPRSDEAIAAKLMQVLTDDAFRVELERHGLEQAKNFSWDKSATRAIAAFEQYHTEHQRRITIELSPARRPKMAYISPLPPERSGISDYSAELLPELSRHYDIDVIVAQDSVTDPWVSANCNIRNVEWFRTHANHYERVLYHFGNSHFHQHMFELLEEQSGIVVLHDFFLSNILANLDLNGLSNRWTQELYVAGGYFAVTHRFLEDKLLDLIAKYPCNYSISQNSLGVIVHSDYSLRLAKHWYAKTEADHWAAIPLLRVPVFDRDRTKARDTLKLSADDFVICSFGLLGPTKLNHRLLEAWLSSDLAKDSNCILVFVGANHEGEYGQELLTTIRRSGLSKRVRITGWADKETFHHYLAATDVGVQLRTLSRGETSAAVLDCMNYGLATIVNADGSMADLPDDAVWKLPDDFSDIQLIEALDTLWRDAYRRDQLGERAREIILNHHAPRTCANHYFAAIENFYRNSTTDINALMQAMALVEPRPADPNALPQLAEAVAKSIQPSFTNRQLLVDVSGLVMGDSKDNAQPDIQKILRELLTNSPDGLRVEPVYATTDKGYRYARSFTLELLRCPPDILNDEPIEYQSGDVFLSLDSQPHVVVLQKDFYQQMRRHGVNVQFAVYDLFVQCTAEERNTWLEVVAESDGAVCITKDISEELNNWINEYDAERLRPFNISLIHLGVDEENDIPSLAALLESSFLNSFN